MSGRRVGREIAVPVGCAGEANRHVGERSGYVGRWRFIFAIDD